MVFRSPFPDIRIPDLPLHEFVLDGLGPGGDKAALVDGSSGRTLTFAQLAGAVERLAAGLASGGFGKGDVLAVLLPNLPEYAIAVYGVSRAGGVSTTVNPLYRPARSASSCRTRRRACCSPSRSSCPPAARRSRAPGWRRSWCWARRRACAP